MPCTCCLTICYSRNSLEDKTWEEFLLLLAAQNVPGRQKPFSTTGRKCLFCSFPFRGRQGWGASGIFLGMLVFVLRKLEFCGVSVVRESFNISAWSRVRRVAAPEFIHRKNAGHKNHTHANIPRQGSQHPHTSRASHVDVLAQRWLYRDRNATFHMGTAVKGIFISMARTAGAAGIRQPR